MRNVVACSQAQPCWQLTELTMSLLSPGARAVLQRWVSSGHFLNVDHEPTVLSLTGSDRMNFIRLVQEVDSNISPTAICNELLRKGVVEQYDGVQLLLRRSAYTQAAPVWESALSRQQEMTETEGVLHRHHIDNV